MVKGLTLVRVEKSAEAIIVQRRNATKELKVERSTSERCKPATTSKEH
jgi:hypothetical protein